MARAVVMWMLAGALVACLAAALWASPRLQEARRILDTLRPVVLEMEGLEERLAAIPRRRLTESEVETFRRDGVLLLRGVVADRGLLRDMVPALRQHQQIRSADYTVPWAYNGVARALLQSGLLTGPVVQLHTAPAQLRGGPIWGYDGEEKWRQASWHQDMALDTTTSDSLMVTAWLAITDAPHGLEMMRGTSDFGVRLDLTRRCNRSGTLGKAGERLLDSECVLQYAKTQIDPRLGYSSHMWFDMTAGDMILFHGNVAHRGLVWANPRLAISVRLVSGAGSDLSECSATGLDTIRPGTGGPDLGCLEQQLLPRPQQLWPMWRGDRLPPVRKISEVHRWLRWGVSGLSWALLSV
mmetsp:Transcript_95740/g.298124  ORF Transcript_95740/g.298124 Transcript_95740/m.298124 type:complete len:354 (-) Transcript_95740:47-1108(-)